ncbi:MAG TPA: gamma-glutamyl-gamma-aminobutyrate hydrolase family protein, partial [Streptosporangiaceae bacterium]|nr:gamma-glutamyl-gamma-aminobutyrate hydrolase family protein [Streptosporangiaceae bacterium]
KGAFEVTAVTPDGVVMAIEDERSGRWGVQFHPESILSASGRAGHQVIGNVLRLCQARGEAARAGAAAAGGSGARGSGARGSGARGSAAGVPG